jgi:hypothetical protein
VQSSTGGAGPVTINFTGYSHHILTLTGYVEITLTSLVSGMSRRVTLEIVQDGTGGRATTWVTTNIRFPNGTPPSLSTTANDVNVLEFTWNGTNFTLTSVSVDVS